jgi:hypothetical protein
MKLPSVVVAKNHCTLRVPFVGGQCQSNHIIGGISVKNISQYVLVNVKQPGKQSPTL